MISQWCNQCTKGDGSTLPNNNGDYSRLNANKLDSDFCVFSVNVSVSQKSQYKDVNRRTKEILQRAPIFKANYCLKVRNAHLKVSIANFGISLRNVLLSCTNNCFQVNKAVRTDHTQKQWVDLGFLCEAYITRPETCGPEGAAVGFWMKLTDCPDKSGIISSFQLSTGFVFRCSSQSMMLVLNTGKESKSIITLDVTNF